MKKQVELDVRDQRMLDLLASGVDNKVIAKKMGYTEGTMRVYLHDLYRKIGVRNKTAAVVWHFDKTGVRKPGTMAAAAPPPGPTTEECFGDYALRANLHAALGAMNMFLGPFGRLWLVAARRRMCRASCMEWASPPGWPLTRSS